MIIFPTLFLHRLTTIHWKILLTPRFFFRRREHIQLTWISVAPPVDTGAYNQGGDQTTGESYGQSQGGGYEPQTGGYGGDQGGYDQQQYGGEQQEYYQ